MTTVVEIKDGTLSKRVFTVTYSSSQCDKTHVRYYSLPDEKGELVACFNTADVIVRYNPTLVKEAKQ
jgi:hypothetical protein